MVLQTRTPTYELFQEACAEDYESFARREIEQRKALFYPPFSRLARLTLTRRARPGRQADARRLREIFRRFEVRVLGPSFPAHRPGRTVFLLKAASRSLLERVCREALATRIPLIVDLDPDRG